MKKVLSIALFLAMANMPFINTASASTELHCAGYTVKLQESSAGLIASNNLNLDSPQVVAMDTDNSCAVVVWNTDKLSTSQVVFAKEGESRSLDILDSNEKTFWGYSQGSAQNNSAQIHHVMIINNLEKDSKYYLRAVSRPHSTALPFVSKEIKFKFEDARVSESGDRDNTQDQSTVLANVANTNTGAGARNSSYSQIDLANSINRYYAPAHSEGKMMGVTEGTEAKKQESQALKEESQQGEQNLTEAGDAATGESNASSTVYNEGEDNIVDLVGAANAGDSLSPLWEKIKDFFARLFESKESDSEEAVKQDSADEEQVPANESEENASTSANLKSDGDTEVLASSSVVVSIKSVGSDGDASEAEALQEEEGLSANSVSLEEGMDTLAKSSVAAASSAKSSFFKLGILALILPVVLLLAVLYVLQYVLSKNYEWIQGKGLAFWMISFAVISLAFALLKNTALALSFLAFFLISLAWHLFNIAVSDMEEGAEPESVDRVSVDKA